MIQRRSVLTSLAGLSLGSVGGFARAAPAIGQPAPAFSAPDTAGQMRRLADFRGKFVVLEWTNPGCPFVRKHYNPGNMQALQKEFGARGVVWLAINSTEPLSTDYLAPAALAGWMKQQSAAPGATLMDPSGSVGKLYGARTTPHMYIVDPQGLLIYAGGIDSIASARESDIKLATNFVRQGLTEALAGKPISVATSAPYGCSVKYKA